MQIMVEIMVKKSGKRFQHTVRFDDTAEQALEAIKEYYRKNNMDDDDSSIIRAAIRFYDDFLHGRIKQN